MLNNFRPERGRGRGRGRRGGLPENEFENVPAQPQNRLENILQAIQQQNTLILQALQNGQVPQPAPPPARRNVVNEPVVERQGPQEPELPPPPPLRPQGNVLPEFIKCNRYFEGLPSKPEEAEDWLAQIGRSFDVFQVPEALKVSYASYLLRLRARLWWDSKQRSLPQPITWQVFRGEFLKEYFPSSLRVKFSTDLLNLTQGSKSIDEYEHEFNRLLQFAPDAYRDNDELKRQTFMIGLEPNFQRRLAEFELPNYAAMIEKARIIERAKLQEVERYKKRGQNSGKRTFDNFPTTSTFKKTRFFKPFTANRSGAVAKNNVTCWKCKGSHYPRECPQLQHKCYYCGESGHMANLCPKRMNATCFICHKVGHIATSCPQRVNNTAGSAQTKGTVGATSSKNGNANANKVNAIGRVYAMHGTVMDNVSVEEDDGENIWEQDESDDCGLIAGM